MGYKFFFMKLKNNYVQIVYTLQFFSVINL